MKTTVSILALYSALSLFAGGAALAEARLDPPEPTVNGHYQVAGNWSELKRGWNTLVLKVTDSGQTAMTGATVKVAYDMVGMPMNPPDRPVVEKGDGIYEKRVFLGMPGSWKFDTEVTSGDVADSHGKIQEVTQ